MIILFSRYVKNGWEISLCWLISLSISFFIASCFIYFIKWFFEVI